MKNKLKQFRVEAGMTQTEVAKRVGVSQPNYQRWESGAASIPDDKIKKLAKVLKTTGDRLLNRHAPIAATFYDDKAPKELNYYGEVAVHFRSGCEPLLLSISDAEFERLDLQLQQGLRFVNVESMANQTVIFRTDAIAEVYFSSEAYDDFGPEHDRLRESYFDIRIVDPRDWEMINALQYGEDNFDTEAFAPEDVERVRKLFITEEEHKKLVAENNIPPEEADKIWKKVSATEMRLFRLAKTAVIQLSTGQQREVSIDVEPADLFNAVYELIEFAENPDVGDGMIHLNVAGWHRSMFVNKNAFDYMSLPTQILAAGRTDSLSEELDDTSAA